MFLARGLLDCNGGGSCGIFTLRPNGLTDNVEPGNLDNRAPPAPTAGLQASSFHATLSQTVPAGQTMMIWIAQLGTSNVFVTCEIDGGASSCDGTPNPASIPGGTDMAIVVNTSYLVGGNPFLDITWQGQ